jgi:hypothetical protein
VGKVHLFDQTYKLYATDWGRLMVALSFSEAIMTGLEQERAKACELNNLWLYKIAQGLLWIGEGKGLGEVARLLGVSAKTVWNWCVCQLALAPLYIVNWPHPVALKKYSLFISKKPFQ